MAASSQGTWRVLLCDKYGQAISNISAICYGKQFVFTLNRPASFTFWVPSDDPRVSGLNTSGSVDNAGDGLPFLNDNRSVRAYRYELQSDGSYKWIIRFAGHVWQITDDGDGERTKSTVVCFDPLQMLTKRIARRGIWLKHNASASPFLYPYWYFTDPLHYGWKVWDDASTFDPQSGQGANSVIQQIPGTDLARGLLNCTNYYDGFTGLDDYYLNQHMNLGYTYPAGTTSYNSDQRPPVSTSVSPTFQDTVVADALNQLTGHANSFDLEVVPTDGFYNMLGFPFGDTPDYRSSPGGSVLASLGGTDDGPGKQGWSLSQAFPPKHDHAGSYYYQTLGLLKFHAPIMGSTLSNVVFGYGTPPHNVASISVSHDKSNLANFNRVVGKNGKQYTSLDGTSMKHYGHVFMAAPTTSQSSDRSILAAHARELTSLGAYAQQAVTITPAHGPNQHLPWDDFYLGDYVQVVAGSKLRGGYSSLVRVWSFQLDVGDDHMTETVSQLATTPTSY